MIKLSNDLIEVHIKKKGAELSSIYNQHIAHEYIWQGDPSIWPWHAPNLFPIVGGLKHNRLFINGAQYELARHGFARHSNFQVIESSTTHAIFSLRYNNETLRAYPYRFEFQVIYHLENESLNCTYKTLNLDEQQIYFSVGGHPAFNVPFFPDERYDDYYLEFEKDEPLQRHHLSSEGYFNKKQSTMLLEGRKLRLNETLFNEDALVFKSLASRRVSIRSNNHPHALIISYPDFKSLGIWAKPGAPFVCVEPWLGYADDETGSSSIETKEGIVPLAPGHVFEASYSISIQ
ncbi:aldose 1-epimerase family protein [Olivibacter sp. XZL3]|uniref:aldose 1-epimerase family protein n=1 Tax=Olivibacter sp. XZL3 TaxID=1735116 RepID=UPI001066D58C|nr:aldose 1-epimerase family protein [Olivibacter sp. XZL3]